MPYWFYPTMLSSYSIFLSFITHPSQHSHHSLNLFPIYMSFEYVRIGYFMCLLVRPIYNQSNPLTYNIATFLIPLLFFFFFLELAHSYFPLDMYSWLDWWNFLFSFFLPLIFRDLKSIYTNLSWLSFHPTVIHIRPFQPPSIMVGMHSSVPLMVSHTLNHASQFLGEIPLFMFMQNFR